MRASSRLRNGAWKCLMGRELSFWIIIQPNSSQRYQEHRELISKYHNIFNAKMDHVWIVPEDCDYTQDTERLASVKFAAYIKSQESYLQRRLDMYS